MVIIYPKIRTTSNNTTEALEVSSLDWQGVYPSQECIASIYSRGCSSQKLKPEAAESARLSVAQRPTKSAPADSIWKSPHLAGSHPADPAPPEYRPAPVYPRPAPSRMP
ncbi:hypothetical protein Tco_0729714 [Tanacetum coccineum]|uniref:Uncharacterized protein n=1 Tax=Tanacetum coccineum TaxID=301880 RepID=A0ABQ4YSR8_9ASTR